MEGVKYGGHYRPIIFSNYIFWHTHNNQYIQYSLYPYSKNIILLLIKLILNSLMSLEFVKIERDN